MKISNLCFTPALAFLFWVFSVTNGMANVGADHQGTAAELILETPIGLQSSALLLDTRLDGEISGLVASITLTQTFKNPSADWVNGRYVFPLPEQAAIDSMVLETDGRILRGVVKEKEQAKKEFQAAKKAGKKAGLLQQNRPNLFSMSLANIAPHGEVVAEITWVETIKYDSGRFSLRLPTTLTPRFIPGTPIFDIKFSDLGETELIAEEVISVDSSSGWSQGTDQVPDAAEITPWQISAPETAGSHQFSINIELKPGITLDTISSATHAIQVMYPDEQKVGHTIQFANGSELLDRDVLIEWTPNPSSRPDAAVFTQKQNGEFQTLAMIMPPVQNIEQTLPREIIFIIDSSGSMAGVSMQQAKQGLITALGYLSPADRFNIIDFDSSARSLFANPVPATQTNLGLAHHFVYGLDPEGGTNMKSALKLAFAQTGIENYLRQIVFITDGSVGNESALFSLIHSQLGNARLFTMGIGSAPNSHFMRGAAHYGRGSFSYIGSLDQAASKMNTLFSKINRPVMQDITIDWPDDVKLELYPRRIPDLYVGEPLMLVIKSSQELGEFTIRGTLAGSPWQRTLNTQTAATGKNLDKIWAKRKIDHLESEQIFKGQSIDLIKDKIVALGVDHQLVTRFTSFIAVEEQPTKPVDQIAKDKSVPNLMPKGNTMAVPAPNTATPATLQILLGSLMLLMGTAWWWLSKIITAFAYLKAILLQSWGRKTNAITH